MKIYQVSREYGNIASAGGVKEVVEGLARAFARRGLTSTVFIPLYGFIDKKNLQFVKRLSINLSFRRVDVDVYYCEDEGVNLYFLDYKYVRDKKSVYTYTRDDESENSEKQKGKGFLDNGEINIVFQLAVTKFINLELDAPDLFILHDSHCSLIPGIIDKKNRYKQFYTNTKLLFLIHNTGYIYHQQINYKKIRKLRIINPSLLKEAITGRDVDPLFLGALTATSITVSPYYAEEIIKMKHSEFDGGFGEFCNKNGIVVKGITNGINIKKYLRENLYKVSLKKNLLASIVSSKLLFWGKLDSITERPLFLFQNRITEQKGVDLFIKGVSEVLDRGFQGNFVVMGDGEKRYEDLIIDLSSKYRGSFLYIEGYIERIAVNLFNASDFFLLTSKWEPCGLTDMEALLAGSFPIVSDTGGLKKVINGVTGFRFKNNDEFIYYLEKAASLYKDATLEDIVDEGKSYIVENFGWDKVVENEYLPFIKGLGVD